MDPESNTRPKPRPSRRQAEYHLNCGNCETFIITTRREGRCPKCLIAFRIDWPRMDGSFSKIGGPDAKA